MMIDFPEQTETNSVAEGQTMTLMIRGIPCSKTQEDLMQTFAEHGLDGTYDFLYLPRPGRSLSNLGYAFVNFPNPRDASRCISSLDGLLLDPTKSTKICTISPARIQGLAMLRKHFRKTAVSRCTRGPVFFRVGSSQESAQPFDMSAPNICEQALYQGPEALYQGPVEHKAQSHAISQEIPIEAQFHANPQSSAANLKQNGSNVTSRVQELLEELEQLMPDYLNQSTVIDIKPESNLSAQRNGVIDIKHDSNLSAQRNGLRANALGKSQSVPNPHHRESSQAFSEYGEYGHSVHSLPKAVHNRQDNVEPSLVPFMVGSRDLRKPPAQLQTHHFASMSPPGPVQKPHFVSTQQQSFEGDLAYKREMRELFHMQMLRREEMQKAKRMHQLQQMEQMQQIPRRPRKQELEYMQMPRYCGLESQMDDMYFITEIPEGSSYSI